MYKMLAATFATNTSTATPTSNATRLSVMRHASVAERNSSASAGAAGGHELGKAYTLPPSAAAAGSAGRASRNLAPNSTAANLVANETTTKTPSASDRPAARRMSRSITAYATQTTHAGRIPSTRRHQPDTHHPAANISGMPATILQ